MTLVRSRLYPALIMFATVLLCTAVYLPGLSGPWIFDDYTNIIHNSYVRITSLDGSSLYHAAFSMESGPLKRPIAVMSFALNHYFANGFNTTPFKITNLVIHLVNALLVFWLAALILMRARELANPRARHSRQSHGTVYILAACAALIWSIHPLQLTSVLYVVQRMTELAATFTLLGLIGYLHGRRKMLAGQRTKGLWLAFAGIVGGGALGILSKENAALLPLFVVLLEFFLFHDEPPWRQWKFLSEPRKRAIWILAILTGVAALLLVVNYALPRYEIREFTMFERLVTEARVLFFYLSLLFLPSISRLGHQHDDIVVSSSLFAPWTTLPSVIGIILLIVAGVWLRKRNPLLGLGILWFFTGHLMESTILPLEIAHEHRNYFPSFGFALGIAAVLARPMPTMQSRRLIWAAFVAITIAYAGTTYLRASQWSDHNSFYRYELAHHPQSARIQIGYSVLLAAQGRHEEAQAAIRRAATLNPGEAGYVIELLLLDVRQKRQPNPADSDEVLRRLRDEKIMATTVLTLDTVDGCLQTWCNVLVPHMEQWIEIILKKPDAPDPYYFQYRLGRIKAIQQKYEEALNLFQKAHEADRHFLHPLFEQISIFLKLGQVHNAEYVLAKLKQANADSRYPRDQEISMIEAEINRLREQAKQP
jgi:tetratricopeptide (TPR) repeat protein